MIEKYTYKGEGYEILMSFGEWTVALLRYEKRFSEFDQLERHLQTDEAFVLLEGEARLYTDTESVSMEKGTLYNIPKGEWHHIVVSRDASVLIVENSNTSPDNTERKML